MGVILSGPRSKEAYLRAQAEKARREARQAREADDPSEAARLEDVAKRAEEAADSTRQQLEDSVK
jgi:hypothetical protein